MRELIVKSELNLFNLNWIVSLRPCAIFTEMVWLTIFPTFIEMCWNSSSTKLAVRRLILNCFWWPSSMRANSRQSRGLSDGPLTVLLTSEDIRYHILIILIQLLVELTELVKILMIMISNQMCFSQSAWKLSLKLTNEQI